MGVMSPRRALYRSRQFFLALTNSLKPITLKERSAAWACLPESARLGILVVVAE